MKSDLGKAEAGDLGEEILVAWYANQGKTATRLNAKRSNLPVDMFEGDNLIEVKTGLVSNSPDAQKWRMTIGEPGNEEKIQIAQAGEEEKTEHHKAKQEKIGERKELLLKELSKALDTTLGALTVCLILDPDRKIADLFKFQGWHQIIRWNSDQAKEGYIESIKYE